MKNDKMVLNYHKNGSADSRKFVDFNKLKLTKGFNGERAAERANSFMLYTAELVKDGETQKASDLFQNFHEYYYFPRLGFCKKSRNGKGTSPESFIEVIKLLQEKKRSDLLIRGNIFAPVLVKNYNADKSSDTLIALTLPELSEYTALLANIYGFPTKKIEANYWNTSDLCWSKMQIVLADTENSGEFMIVCPDDILTSRFEYTMANFIFKFWLIVHNESLVVEGKPKLTQEKLREFIKENFGSNRNFLMYIIGDMSTESLAGYLNRDFRSTQN